MTEQPQPKTEAGGVGATVRTQQQPEAITGVEAMMGKGVKEPLGFWADAWSQVIRRPGAFMALAWVGIVAFFAVFAPIVASGHPFMMRTIDTRDAADAVRAVEGALSRIEGPNERELRQAVRLELRNHSPRLALDDVLAGLTVETRQVDSFDERGNLTVKQSLTPESMAEALRMVSQTQALDETGGVARTTSPLITHLSAADWVILLATMLGGLFVLAPMKLKRSSRAWMVIAGAAQATVIVSASLWIDSKFGARDAAPWMVQLQQIGLPDNPPPDVWRWFVTLLVATLAAVTTAVFMFVPVARGFGRRLLLFVVSGSIAATAVAYTWGTPPEAFDYRQREAAGQIEAVYTLVPFSPSERQLDRNAGTMPPGSTTGQALARRMTTGLELRGSIGADGVERILAEAARLPLSDERRDELVTDIAEAAERLPAEVAEDLNVAREAENQRRQQRAQTRGVSAELIDETPETLGDLRVSEAEAYLTGLLSDVGKPFYLGTDGTGQDVLSQLLHACRLSMSVGLVATGIAVFIGVTMGAIMGYFGGFVDLALYRVVEIFMAIPVLFLLIVAADVLPRNTYVMMAIIGMFTWHGAARFTRAEFYKLRNQDFVQSARAAGLPLRSVLFKHMLPNGVTPVLVDASFRIALAILFETILSYLGLGPEDQPSWGRLLSDAIRAAGGFNWWLAIFPGFAIFLTVLGYNLIGEALRDAIDPKLKKARV